MGGTHLWRALELGGVHQARLLSEMAGAGGEVDDPFGRADEVYWSTFEQLRALVAAVLVRVVEETGEVG